uniref:Structure-specific endonuclease subunit SLX4 n=1 Tax=Knipowitschia caucasica TaxID=637954 RepID=A0AAV2LMN1_KNICA
MRKFRRASPPRMMLGDQGIQEECQRPIHPGAVDSDEALAMRLQQELDRDTRAVDLEDEGLFFCQLCNKNLSHMTPDGRTQHINRCLDEEEHIAPAPAPGIMECPICGKRFKSEKNRASHMKRCSSDMGVPPAVLMQALQRQAEETHSSSATNTQTAGQKRKGSKSNMPASKKPRKKPGHMDEDTMMAIALSSSLLEQEKQLNLQDATAPSTSKSPALKWNADAGKGRSKKKRGANARPLPLLLVQDPGAAAAKIQERVSTLLLCTRAPSPPAPTRCTSTLSGQSGAAPLWQKSALLSGLRPTDFYVPALLDIVAPQESSTTVVSGEVAATPILKSRTSCASIVPSQMGCSSPLSTPGPGRQIPGGSQALQDLMDLAEDGMTLTQYGYSTTELTKDQQSGKKHISRLHSFVVEKEEELSNDHVSGFLPETVDDDHKEQREEEEARQKTRLLARLAVDLGSMVNNPQLSDVQLQVDSGEVYFAHSFMVYARCPLLAEMMHESGFGVQEEGVPAAQRVLLNDVPGPAVLALLQFLYTAKCSVPPSLRPYILELASRFDLKDLQDFCRLPETVFESGDCERLITHTDKDFAELLRSMWHEEDPEDADHHSLDDSKEMEDHPGDICSGDGEIQEDKVNEDELEEIYEFAATQKKREEENEADSGDPPEISTSPPKIHDANTENVVNTSLDRSYSRLFSETWGDFEEKPEQKSHLPARLVSSEMSARTLLQSSASVIDKLSPTPPPNAQNLPVPGQSFMDEPPMAFNDSWGLDACAENPCFSLKLDDSEGSDQQQRSLENIKMATPQSMNAGISSSASPHRMSTETSVILPPEIEAPQDVNNILMDSKVWDSWDDEDEKDTFPSLSERLKPPVQYKTPISKFKNRQSLVPITPLPHYSDMDTPELKNKLNKFGVRPLPKRQMVLKLKEIHQYTHQLVSSDSEDEAPSAGQTIPAAVRQTSCAIPKFKKPSAVTTSPLKQPTEDEPLSASQGSNTSSTAESERSNPEIVQLSDGDSDSDGGVSASQSASRLQDRLQAVRTFIMSDSSLYNKILQYQPLVLTQLQQQLKTAGIRLGVSKLADYLDSQCITFTTAKPGQSAPSRRRVKKNKGETAVRRKKNTAAAH